MKIMALTVLLFLCAMACSQPGHASDAVASDDVTVCFLDFRISLEVGRTESSIQQAKYCRYKISRKTFLSLLVPEPPTFYFEGRDVRAMVLLPATDKYFIDENGSVRFDGKLFKVDKTAFFNALKGRKKIANQDH
ncbi:hypothetical protein [Dyella mobilis]|uniref:Lipoprotein n=1 Tax=Dyella mobilis TaxID=1849582 RepID=A0ABS2KEI2_9GAMM|nr:hypothetical protein [Dyella mobilis]MBM7129470.1 hypothetical protein [Dyella mobilis]GLQ98266.1 hypothetical protein GCM10007863_26860 [Dyella mobilis]